MDFDLLTVQFDESFFSLKPNGLELSTDREVWSLCLPLVDHVIYFITKVNLLMVCCSVSHSPLLTKLVVIDKAFFPFPLISCLDVAGNQHCNVYRLYRLAMPVTLNSLP